MAHGADLELLLKYPLILKTPDKSEWKGYLTANEKDYKIHITTNRNHDRFDLEMTRDLEKFQTQLESLSSDSADPSNLLTYLDKIVAVLAAEKRKSRIKSFTRIYRAVLREYYELRQFYINIHGATLSGDLKTIRLDQVDIGNRKHSLTVDVNYDGHGKLFRIKECDLPQSGDAITSDDSLVCLYEKFLARIECPKLQTMFAIMDEIDNGCWVLEPEKPSRRDFYRRIMIDSDMSVVVTFDTADVRDPPLIRFLGPQHAVKKFSEALDKNITQWDSDGNILQELMKLLEISEFPQKPETSDFDRLVNEGECVVCFSLRFRGKAPDVVCPNRSCSKLYHGNCLYQCLLSSSYRKYYREIVGLCPNCDKVTSATTIHCPIQTDELS